MKTVSPKPHLHVPKRFIVDASNKTLGRLATEVSKLLRGKENSYFTPGIDQGNFVIILNSSKIEVSGNKNKQKLYYRNSQRPGNLKIETFDQLKSRLPNRIIEKAIWGMLPKGVLGRNYFKRLYVYSGNEILYKKTQANLEKTNNENWIHIDF